MTTSEDDVVFRKLRPTSDPTSYFPRPTPETIILPKGSTYGPGNRPAPLGARWHGGTRPLPADIQFDKDRAVTMRDGSKIYADVFRPPGTDNVPAIVAWSPYGKQGGYWNYCRGNLGAIPPREWVSGLQKFEGPDPAEWVQHGYAVVHPDPPGAFGSEGLMKMPGEAEGRHAHDLIEWVAEQSWCSGRVGMAGNSWLTASQWFAAAQQPPHLAAIAPWNGFHDIYDFTAPGGIPAPQFAELLIDFQWGTRMEWLPKMIKKYPLKNDYWATHEAALNNIDIPAYVAHTWQLGVHKWTPEAFRQLATENKWLRLANTHEWHDQYAPENVADLRKFFDRYLKDIDNGWEDTPRVRITVLDPGLSNEDSANGQYSKSKGYVPAAVINRPENEWPLARTQQTDLFLRSSGELATQVPTETDTARYSGRFGSVSFVHTFTEDTELTGYTTAHLWIAGDSATDADLFLDLCKLDSRGKRLGTMETTCLRVSHREIDAARSTSFVTHLTHRREDLLTPGEPVEVTITFAPSSMLFKAGEKLRLRVAGNPLKWRRDPTGGALGDLASVSLAPIPRRNRGNHTLHYGGKYNAYLSVPVIPSRPTSVI